MQNRAHGPSADNSRRAASEKISIFDRFGKLLKQINTSGDSWDGMLNNNLLPEADHWFKFKRVNGREFKGHFTLKRQVIPLKFP